MEVILIEGKDNTGKTTICLKIETWLLDMGFKEIKRVRTNAPKHDDFMSIYEHIECKTIIVINSGSDLITLIRKFEEFYNDLKIPKCNVLISAIRPEGTIKNRHDVHEAIKNIYKSDIERSERIIYLEKQTKSTFEKYLKDILRGTIPLIFNDLKLLLKCKLTFKENSLDIFK